MNISDLIRAVVQEDHDVSGIGIKGSECGVIVVARHNRTVVHTVGQASDGTAILGINITLALGGRGEAVVIGRDVNQSIVMLTARRG